MKKDFITSLNNQIIQDILSIEELITIRGGKTINFSCPPNTDCSANNVGCSPNDKCAIDFECGKDKECINRQCICPNTTNCSNFCKNRNCSPDQFCPVTEIHSIGSC